MVNKLGRIISFSNQKGGVGKTTSAANVGAALARKGYKVVLVDLDPQCNLTQAFGLKDPEHTVYGALLGEHAVKGYPVKENLIIVPGATTLSSFDKVKGDELDKEFLLKELLEPFRSRCDFMILDCPPSLGLITVNALAAADEVYIPLEAQLFGVDGVERVLQMVSKINQRINPDLKVGGIFFTRHTERKILSRDTAEDLRDRLGEKVLSHVIRENIALQEAPTLGKDIFDYDPECNGARDYEALALEMMTSKSSNTS